METQINVLLSEWVANGVSFPAGSQEIEVSDELRPALAHAVALGLVELEDPSAELLTLLDGHVESQEASEEKLAEAMGEWVAPKLLDDGTTESGYWTGPWQEGHLAAQELVREAQGPNGNIEISIDIDDVASLGSVLGESA